MSRRRSSLSLMTVSRETPRRRAPALVRSLAPVRGAEKRGEGRGEGSASAPLRQQTIDFEAAELLGVLPREPAKLCRLFVECRDETDQHTLAFRLRSEGYQVREVTI